VSGLSHELYRVLTWRGIVALKVRGVPDSPFNDLISVSFVRSFVVVGRCRKCARDSAASDAVCLFVCCVDVFMQRVHAQ
jgi:hypothetical protein